MKENKIFNKYVLRNAIIPTITKFSLSLAFMISGVALIEIVFCMARYGQTYYGCNNEKRLSPIDRCISHDLHIYLYSYDYY